MSQDIPRHWLHPQTVPRGFLRMYILNLLSSGPESGYSIMQRIEDSTEGAWRPGAGTMYPLLRSLTEEGVVRVAAPRRRTRRRTYVLTPQGMRDLEELKRVVATMSKKERVMGRLFSDLLPGDMFVAMVIGRFREGEEVFRKKVVEIPRPARDIALREFRLLMEGQILWIDSLLGKGNLPGDALQPTNG